MHWIDPASLPQTEGILTQWILSPHGELEGFVLNGKDQVHFPPHLSKKTSKLFELGDTVRVRGIKPRGAEMIVALSLSNVEGKEIVDRGPEHEKHAPAQNKRKPLEIAGVVSLALRGPRGEIRGALLEDGTALWIPPHAADALSEYLDPGIAIRAWGPGLKSKKGRAIDVESIAHDIAPEDSANPGAVAKNRAPQKVVSAVKKQASKTATPTSASARARSPSAIGGDTQAGSKKMLKSGAAKALASRGKALSPETIATNTIHSVKAPAANAKGEPNELRGRKSPSSSTPIAPEIIEPRNRKTADKRAVSAKNTPSFKKTAQ